jgi:hypothetical protein
MTLNDFRDRIEPLLDRDPFVPVVLDLTSGERVYLDMANQLEVGPTAAVITRRSERRPRTIPLADIAAVAPLDQLPGDGGPTYDEFQATLRRLYWADPRPPFVVELKSGERIAIPPESSLAFAGRFAHVDPKGGDTFVQFSQDQVARIVIEDPIPSR